MTSEMNEGILTDCDILYLTLTVQPTEQQKCKAAENLTDYILQAYLPKSMNLQPEFDRI